MQTPYFTKSVIKTILVFTILFSLDISCVSAQYCVVPASLCGGTQNYVIENVSFQTINNTSSCGPNGYSDYTGSVAAPSVTAGTFVPMTVTVGAGTINRAVYVGIDFNHSLSFTSDEIIKLGEGSSVITGNVIIPFGALSGTTRLRIRATDYASAVDMCGGLGYGETEDYTVNISPSPGGGPYFSFYVNAAATGANNGTSWTNAYSSLNSALAYATKRDTIRVAAGRYQPGNFQNSTYTIRDSVVILGGYPSSGNPTDADRNVAMNQTILDAERGDPANTQDNIDVLIDANGTTSFARNYIIDGFIFESANQSALHMAVCSSPQIRNCVFRKNYGTAFGSALNIYLSQPTFLNCYFYDNNNGSEAIAYLQYGSSSFINCIFADNHNTYRIIGAYQNNCSIINSSFANNVLLTYPNQPSRIVYAENNSNLTISNSIFYHNFNDGSEDSTEISFDNSVMNISNTITQVYDAGNAALFHIDPKFRDINSTLGADNLYFTADDGLHLINPCSPAINAGSNAAINGITKDIEGNARIVGPAVDLGAYEVQSATSAIPTALYVNKLATGNNDGSNWTNAFTDLQTALYSCSDTIRIAEGTYYPSTTDETVSFWLQNNRVLLGGYPSTGNPTDADRDPVSHPTVLSGNYTGTSINSSFNVVRARAINNTSRLDGLVIADANNIAGPNTGGGLYMEAGCFPDINNCRFTNNFTGIIMAANCHPTIKSTFFVSNGFPSVIDTATPVFLKCTFTTNRYPLSHRVSNSVIDSCLFENNGGRSISYTDCTHPILTNSKFNNDTLTNIFSHNSSAEVNNCSFWGSGINNWSAYEDYGAILNNEAGSAPVFTKCVFENGNADAQGGVCYNDNSSPSFYNCVFKDSWSSGYIFIGGGVFANKNASDLKVINCIASGNKTGSSGSFIYNENSHAQILNSTIVSNKCLQPSDAGGVIANFGTGTVNVDNCILWENSLYNGDFLPPGEIIGTGTTVVKNSLLQDHGLNGANGNILRANPRFIDITNPAGPDGIYFTADDGLSLCSCSPAINKGSASPLTANGITTDIISNPRIFNALPDMGAYELQSATLTSTHTVYVKESAAGLNDGSSWANAYTDLQKAIHNTCSDTIKIAAGTYKPALLSRDSSFFINRGMVIWGGYPNSGNPNDNDRNADINPSILSGDIGILSDSTDNTHSVLNINCTDTIVNLQGLTIRDGNNNLFLNNGGGGIYAHVARDLQIADCRFYHNKASYGAGVYVTYDIIDSSGTYITPKLSINKCVFGFNKSINGALCFGLESQNASVKNSVFTGNATESGGMGGAIYVPGGKGNFENLLFYNNSGFRGAGMAFPYYLGNFMNITNCSFVNNKSTGDTLGVDIYSYGTPSFISPTPAIRNCIFKGCSRNDTLLTNQSCDFALVDPGIPGFSDAFHFNLQNSAIITSFANVTTNISPAGVSFANINNPIGADNIWFTADDGLKPDACSLSTDKGDNIYSVSIPTDLNQQSRIYNSIVDMGAYEYQGDVMPLVYIDAATTNICSGVPVTFTATDSLAGNNPLYQWQVNGVNAGTNNAEFITSTLNNGDVVTCILSSNPNCSTGFSVVSNAITVTVNATVLPSVTISASTDSICSGDVVNFAAVPVNGGLAPSYQWQINGINAGANDPVFITSSLQNNDQVTVILTSNQLCASPNNATSNSIMMAVTNLDIPLISINNNIISITNPDANAVYTWQILNGTVWEDVNPLANGTDYTVTQPGTYRVRATKGVCEMYSDGLLSARQSNTPYGIIMYPNPTTGVLVLDQLSLADKWETLEIKNAQGQNLYPAKNIRDQASLTLHVERLASGVYFIKLKKADGKKLTLGFIKK